MESIFLSAWEEIWPQINTMIVQPALSMFAVYLGIVLKKLATKTSDSITDCQNKAALDSVTNIQANVMVELRHVVEAAVAASMEMANELKARNGGSLTAEQISDLRIATKEIINTSLPNDLTDDGGSIKELIGGEVALSRIIDSMIEQYVIEVKSKIAICDSSTSDIVMG